MVSKRKILIATILTVLLALLMEFVSCVAVRVGSPDTLDTGVEINKKDTTSGPRYRR